MSYKPVFIFAGGERADNAQRFETENEARASAAARFMVWTMPTDYDVEESIDLVNYKFDGKDIRL